MTPQKTAIITGGNVGLGYYTAQELAQTGEWQVIVASRNQVRAQAAVDQIRQVVGNTHIFAMKLDLASLASVRQFVAAFANQQVPPLHAIVCNAGFTATKNSTTQDGFDGIFGVNHLGHFLLVNLLLKHLVTPGRIVFVSSGTILDDNRMARLMRVPLPNYTTARALAFPDQAPADQRVERPFQRYSTSKLANAMTAFELARQLQAAGIDTPATPIGVFALDPGLMPDTAFLRVMPAPLRVMVRGLFMQWRHTNPEIRSVKDSGQHLARLVTDPELTGKTALFFDGLKERRASPDSYDRAKQDDLWQTSIELVGLQPHEMLLPVATVAV